MPTINDLNVGGFNANVNAQQINFSDGTKQSTSAAKSVGTLEMNLNGNLTLNRIHLGLVDLISDADNPRHGAGCSAPEGSIFIRCDGAPLLYQKTGPGNNDWTAFSTS